MATKAITLPVLSFSGEKVGDIKLDASVFGITEKNEQAIHDAVVTQGANARQATAKTKKRHEVSGGGKKPWRQKGTGRARAGSSRSPLWVGGGKVFGPDGNQNYEVSQNKKAHALALKTVLSQKVKAGLIVVDDVKADKISTKEFAKGLANVKAEGKVLLIAEDENAIRSATNLGNVTVRACNNISVYDVLNANTLVIGKKDIETLEGGLK
ncbi:MAG: 50S ribosomal protein L4 [Erysipelotrichaceae bacterium]|nr:50S ribosomal protein L4 [Erysipelotrichaceae bacterium]